MNTTSRKSLNELSVALSSAVSFPEYDYDRSTRLSLEHKKILQILEDYVTLKLEVNSNAPEFGNSAKDWAQGIALPLKKPYPIYDLI